MTLLITVFAAVISTLVFYLRGAEDDLNVSMLCFMFWGASLMWLGDAIFEYASLGADYFSPELSDMINDTFLGLSVVAFALVIWTVALLIRDPRGVIKKKLFLKEIHKEEEL